MWYWYVFGCSVALVIVLFFVGAFIKIRGANSNYTEYSITDDNFPQRINKEQNMKKSRWIYKKGKVTKYWKLFYG